MDTTYPNQAAFAPFIAISDSYVQHVGSLTDCSKCGMLVGDPVNAIMLEEFHDTQSDSGRLGIIVVYN